MKPSNSFSRVIFISSVALCIPISIFIEVTIAPNLQSDHIGVLFNVKVCPENHQRRVRDYRNANWPLYENMLSQELAEIQHETLQEIDDACRRFSEAIVKAHDAAVPLKVKNGDEKILSRASIQLIRQKNMIFRRWLRMRDNVPLKTTYASLVKQSKKMVKKSVFEDRNRCWAQYINKCEKSSKTFWAITRRIRRGRSGVPALMVNDEAVGDSQTKANEFANIFVAAHTSFNGLQNQFDCVTEERHSEVLANLADGLPDFTETTYRGIQCSSQSSIWFSYVSFGCSASNAAGRDHC